METVREANGRTQNDRVLDQLKRGVRYLDIRVAGSSSSSSSSSVFVYHGCLRGGTISSVLQDVTDFVQNHPREVVIIEIVPEYGRAFHQNQRRHTLALVQNTFGDENILTTSSCGGRHLSTLSLEEIVEILRKRVVVVVHPRMYECQGVDPSVVDQRYGYFQSGCVLRNEWHDTNHVATLLRKNLAQMLEANPSPRSSPQLVVHQMVLTPQASSLADILQVATGQNSLSVRHMAMTLYQELPGFFHQHRDKHWNIVALDFVDLAPPTLLMFLIGLNFAAQSNRAVLSRTTKDGSQPSGDMRTVAMVS